MTRGDNIFSTLGCIGSDRDSACAIGGADSGGYALARLDRHSEGGFMPRTVLLAHEIKAKRLYASLGQRQADKPASMCRHEVDCIGRGHLCGNYEVTFVLAILVIDQNEHPAIARLVDYLFDPDEDGRIVILCQEALELAQCLRSRVPSGFGAIAQGVHMQSSSPCQARAAHLAFVDVFTNAFLGLFEHEMNIITLECEGN